MTYNDIIGTIGVGIILFTYFLNTMKYIPVNGKLYYVLNSIGGALSCYAALLINFWPFVMRVCGNTWMQSTLSYGAFHI